MDLRLTLGVPLRFGYWVCFQQLCFLILAIFLHFYGSFFELSVMAGAFTCQDQHLHSLKWWDASWDALSLMDIQRSLRRLGAGIK